MITTCVCITHYKIKIFPLSLFSSFLIRNFFNFHTGEEPRFAFVMWHRTQLKKCTSILTHFVGNIFIWTSSSRSVAQVRRSRKTKGSVTLTYSTDLENDVSKIFIISLQCTWRVREHFLFLFTQNGFKFLRGKSKGKRVNLRSFLSRLHDLK